MEHVELDRDRSARAARATATMSTCRAWVMISVRAPGIAFARSSEGWSKDKRTTSSSACVASSTSPRRAIISSTRRRLDLDHQAEAHGPGRLDRLGESGSGYRRTLARTRRRRPASSGPQGRGRRFCPCHRWCGRAAHRGRARSPHRAAEHTSISQVEAPCRRALSSAGSVFSGACMLLPRWPQTWT